MFQILSISPSNNQQAVLRTDPIIVTFDRQVFNVNANSLYLTRLDQIGSVATTIIRVSGSVWKLVPKYPLRTNGVYTVHGTSDITDIAQNSLQPFTSTFTVQYNTADQSILDSYPKDGASAVRVDSYIETIFSEPVQNVNINTYRLFRIKENCIIPPTPTFSVSGIVTGIGHEPLSGVVLNLKDSLSQIIGSTFTNLSGQYSFPNLSSGSYSIQVEPPSGYFGATSPFIISGIDIIDNISLTAIPPSTFLLSGQVTDFSTTLPLSGVTITVTPSLSGSPQNFTTGLDGDFSFTLSPDNYSITADLSGYQHYSASLAISADTIQNIALHLVPVSPKTDIFLMREDQTYNGPPQAFTLANFTYIPNDGSLLVFINGILTVKGIDYQETGSSTVTLLSNVTPYYGGEVGVVSFAKLDLTKVTRLDISSPTVGSSVISVPSYSLGNNNLLVFQNGFLKKVDIDYTETTTTSITLASPVQAGDYFTILSGNPYFESYTLDSSFIINTTNYFDFTSFTHNAVIFDEGRYQVYQFDYGIGGPQEFDTGGNSTPGQHYIFYRSGWLPQIVPSSLESSLTPLSTSSYSSDCEVPIPAVIEQYSPTSWKLIPSAPLAPQSTYLVRLESGITDDQGNPLQVSEFIFQTEFNNQEPEITHRFPFPYDIGVPVDSILSFNFSEPIHSAPDSSIILSKDSVPVLNTISFPNSTTIQIIPDINLDYNGVYQVEFKLGVTDDSGHSVKPEKYTFTTEFSPNALIIQDSSPNNLDSGVLLDKEIIIEFSKPAYGVTTDSLYLKDQFGNIISAIIEQDSPFTFKIKPSSKLDPQTTYFIKITNKVVDDRKNPILYNIPIAFTTEYSEENPAVLNLNPFPGQDSVPLDTTIEITFNKPTFNVSLDSFIVTDKKTGEKVVGSFLQQGNARIFTPDSLLKKGTEYQVALKKSITDENQRSLQKGFLYSFVTENFLDPAVEKVSIQQGNQVTSLEDKQTNLSTTTSFLIQFNKPVADPTQLIDLNPGPFQIIQVDNTTYALSGDPNLNPETDYTLTIDKSIQDDRGTTLGIDSIYRFTTRIIPPGKAGASLINTGLSQGSLLGGLNPQIDLSVTDFQTDRWVNPNLQIAFPNIRNHFPINLPSSSTVLIIGGLDQAGQKTGIWSYDLTSGSSSEIISSDQITFPIDYAGLIKVYDLNASDYKYFITVLSFTDTGTEVRYLDLNSSSWVQVENINSLVPITQALGSWVWKQDGTQTDDSLLFVLGGMTFKNNNLPLKQLQKVRFFLDGGSLKYEVASVWDETNMIFNSSLAFKYGLRTDRAGNDPQTRGSFNNPTIASLRCEEIFPLESGLYERESGLFLTGLKFHILLPFFINPPDGTIKPLIQIYQTSSGILKYNLPRVDFEYPYPNRTEFSLMPLSLAPSGQAQSLLLFGGKNEEGEYLNSTWSITPTSSPNSSFKFLFQKIGPNFTN